MTMELEPLSLRLLKFMIVIDFWWLNSFRAVHPLPREVSEHSSVIETVAYPYQSTSSFPNDVPTTPMEQQKE